MQTTPTTEPRTAPERATVRLTELGVGKFARLHATELVGQERELLAALGLDRNSRFRLSKVGNPCILEVNGTRIGLAQEVAYQLLVLPEEPPR